MEAGVIGNTVDNICLTKYCPDCGIEISVDLFYKSKRGEKGREKYCKEHKKVRQIKRNINMSVLLTQGNIALFEYPKGAENPSFTLDDKGVLWVEGYNFPFDPSGTPIRAMKRFDLGLKGYTLLGIYDKAKEIIQGDFSHLFENGKLDKDNCVVMIKGGQGSQGNENES